MSKKADKRSAKVTQSSILESTFPIWNDGHINGEKDTSEKYEDPAGLVLPPDAQPFLDAWKRPEELVLNMPSVPIITLKPTAVVETKSTKGSKGVVQSVGRDVEGKLFAGHRSFEWLQAVFSAVTSVQKSLKQGDFMWELIHPKEKDGSTARTASGKYKIRLFIMDTWRVVTIDDRIPVDLFGRPLLVGIRPLQLWPLLLTKAILKVMAAYKILGLSLPHQVAAMQLLTGWPQEDLLDSLSGTPVQGGCLFDRLEDAVHNVGHQGERQCIATTCLIKRSLPMRPPPRIIVLAGPSAVGRRLLMQKLVTEFPDKFGLTVSHTTRRPHEHEVQGQDYHFTHKQAMLADVAEAKFLEYAAVRNIHGCAYLYGTSISTVREVAATGKVCIMGLDIQGVQSLQRNHRIDGLYVYVAAPSLQVLEERSRGRLKEDTSTIRKRLEWAEQQVAAAAKPGTFDHIIQNTDVEEVYAEVKEAISTLSPIIRNRLRGLPAYVLDYSDLIPPNLVEKPFLKPVVIAGPTTGERKAVMELLVKEFPDVFAMPCMSTTRPQNEDNLYRVTADELQNLNAADGKTRDQLTDCPDTMDQEAAAMNETVSTEEFERLMQSDGFLEHHTDLFVHPLTAHHTGVSLQQIKQVIHSGRLPLLELEAEGVACLKTKGIDCLSIFLEPPSLDVFKERLNSWLTETDAEIAARQATASAELDLMQQSGFDHVLVNGEAEVAYGELKDLISKHRPDIIPPLNEVPASADQPAAGKQAVLVLAGTQEVREALAQTLVSTFPGKFARAAYLTDRKPGKGEGPTDALQFVSAKELAKLNSEGALVHQRLQDGATVAITHSAVNTITSQGAVAIIDIPGAPAADDLRAGMLANAMYILLAAAGLSSENARTEVNGGEYHAVAAEQPQFDVVLPSSDGMELVINIQQALSSHVPHIISPPFKPLVIAGPFGTHKRVLIQKLFEALPGKFAVPVITSTKPTAESDVDDRNEVAVISQAQAAQLIESGGFLVQHSVLGHVYGITRSAVKKVQAAGRVCVIEVDYCSDIQKLRSEGFAATFLFLGVKDMDVLLQRVRQEIDSNPPLGYDSQDAASHLFAACKAEVQRSMTDPGLIDPGLWIDNGGDPAAAFSQMAECIHLHYPKVVSTQFVWGYGRALWDPAVRVHGRHSLNVMVLGPAAVGKTTLAELVAARFGLPHINVGDLLYQEVQKQTQLGMEAKVFMDDSKTVPDKYFLEVLAQRLQQPDCYAAGWLLDGFPHTAEQAAALTALGIIPDKVVFMNAEHSLLVDRAKYRRIDPHTSKVYHMAEAGALSGPIQPLNKDGKLDQQVAARLHPRHDDSEENVLARLRMADEHMPNLRAAYEDVSMRVPGDATPSELLEAVGKYITLESLVTDIEVTQSHTLKELQYEVIDTLRYRRRQLLRLEQDDKKAWWVDIKELAANSHCLLLAQNPAPFPITHQLRRADLTSVHRTALLFVDFPEPSNILVTMSLGMQHNLEDPIPVEQQVLLVTGPEAAGKSSVINMLLRDCASKVAAVAPVTTRPARKGEETGATYCFVSEDQIVADEAAGAVVGLCQHGEYKYGMQLQAMQAAWASGCVCIVEGPVELAAALKQVPRLLVTCVYLRADLAALDLRMRNAAHVLEEDTIQCELQVAHAEAEALATSAGFSAAVDCVLANNGSVLNCYHSLKETAARLWTRPKLPVQGQVVLEQYSWQAVAPGRTMKQLRTIMAGASLLELPRGKHLLRVTAHAEYLHSLTFLSDTPCTAGEYSKVLPLYEGTSLYTTNYEGEYPALPINSSILLFRYNIRVSAPTKFSASLAVSGDDMRAAAGLWLVDNATGKAQAYGVAKVCPVDLQPTEKGYCILGLAADLVQAIAEEGTWALTITAAPQPQLFQETSTSRIQVLQGSYTSNSHNILGRLLIVPTNSVQLGLMATIEPPLPFKLSLLSLPVGRDAAWGCEYAEMSAHASPDGRLLTAPNILLPPGKYFAQLTLDHPRCPDGSQTSTARSSPVQPIQWRITCLPSADDKVCPISVDDSQQRSFKAMLDGWNLGLNGAAAARADKLRLGKPATYGVARTQQGLAMVELFGSGSSKGTAPSRPLLDGTSMELTSADHLRPQHAYPSTPASCSSSSSSHAMQDMHSTKGSCNVLAARKASEFSEWRNQMLLMHKGLLVQRTGAAAAESQWDEATSSGMFAAQPALLESRASSTPSGSVPHGRHRAATPLQAASHSIQQTRKTVQAAS